MTYKFQIVMKKTSLHLGVGNSNGQQARKPLGIPDIK